MENITNLKKATVANALNSVSTTNPPCHLYEIDDAHHECVVDGLGMILFHKHLSAIQAQGEVHSEGASFSKAQRIQGVQRIHGQPRSPGSAGGRIPSRGHSQRLPVFLSFLRHVFGRHVCHDFAFRERDEPSVWRDVHPTQPEVLVFVCKVQGLSELQFSSHKDDVFAVLFSRIHRNSEDGGSAFQVEQRHDGCGTVVLLSFPIPSVGSGCVSGPFVFPGQDPFCSTQHPVSSHSRNVHE
eukprot:scaffold191_cov677-Pavlova_lutheri.AAC.18